MDNLYIEPVKKLIYQFKERLPSDFPINTERRALYSEVFDTIVIIVDAEHFDWRTVEDRLHIVLTLEALKNAIRNEGVPCLIEKPGQE